MAVDREVFQITRVFRALFQVNSVTGALKPALAIEP